MKTLQQQSLYIQRPLRILLAGDADAGKSTLISVLSKGGLDNGRGSARKDLLKHQHEKESGHTSSIASYVLPYSANSVPIHSAPAGTRPERFVHLFDGCGLQTHLKTTIHGMTATYPDCVGVLVSAKSGVTSMTREHFGVALALKLPVFVVITKVDLAHDLENFKKAVWDVESLIKECAQKKAVPLYDLEGSSLFEDAAAHMMELKAIPVLAVSSVSGEGVTKLHEFLSVVEPREDPAARKQPTEVWIRKVYDLNDVGVVLEGLLRFGRLRRGQVVRLGPVADGFKCVCVKSIVTCAGEVASAEAGEDVALRVAELGGKMLNVFELKKVKGLVLVSKPDVSRLARSFDAEVVVLRKAFIKPGRLVAVHTGPLYQTGEVEDLAGDSVLKQGDKGLMRCKVQDPPVYMRVGERVIFRSGLTTAIGVVTRIYHS